MGQRGREESSGRDHLAYWKTGRCSHVVAWRYTNHRYKCSPRPIPTEVWFYLQGLAEVALQCLCELAVSLSHFNFRNNILTVLVPRMNSKALQGKVGCYCLTPTLVIMVYTPRLRTVGWGGRKCGIPPPPKEHIKFPKNSLGRGQTLRCVSHAVKPIIIVSHAIS